MTAYDSFYSKRLARAASCFGTIFLYTRTKTDLSKMEFFVTLVNG